MIKIVHESERTADLRREISYLDSEQLTFLEECIKKEKKRRQQEIFYQWLNTLESYTSGITHN